MCTGIASCLAAGSGVIFSTSLLYLVVRGWLAGDHFSMIVKRGGALHSAQVPPRDFNHMPLLRYFLVFATNFVPWVPTNW